MAGGVAFLNMDITNEIKRVRGKLQALDNGPFVNQIINDVNMLVDSPWTTEEIIKELREQYLRRLDSLVPKDPLQSKIDFDE